MNPCSFLCWLFMLQAGSYDVQYASRHYDHARGLIAYTGDVLIGNDCFKAYAAYDGQDNYTAFIRERRLPQNESERLFRDFQKIDY